MWFSEAGTRAIDIETMRVYDEIEKVCTQEQRPYDREKWADCAKAMAHGHIIFDIDEVATGFDQDGRELDSELMGAHVLERRRCDFVGDGGAMQYTKLRVKELKELCRIRNLDDTGLKKDLVT
jgi:hypothetical protein